jgi:phosphoribosylamine---glycine ligase
MKILVLGGGGREHAIIWKLRQSPPVEKLWCAPGNGGIANDAECLPLELNDVKAAADLAAKLGADLTIVGPELPLVQGVADEFAARNLALLGPSKKAAMLEGSKVFAKRFMERHKIPTAPVYGIFDSAVDAYTALCEVDWPLVIKADGLCAGKGVLVTSSPDEATSFIDRVMDSREFGDAGKQLILEEGLAGEELSYIILTDGKNLIPMTPTRDHKRAFDGDQGPNTGGMGAFSTDVLMPSAVEQKILANVVRPTLTGLEQDGIAYKGFLYFGLMLTLSGPKVLEFNCRLGDPEAQAILLRADFDFAEACLAATQGNLAAVKAEWKPEASVCVVIASAGYPGNPIIGKRIEGLEQAVGKGDTLIFHSGTRCESSIYYSSGGRVLGVASRGKDLDNARARAYDVVSSIRIEGAHFRHDIGLKVRRESKFDTEAFRSATNFGGSE